jgi:ABC-2 type transport system permease protein
VSASVGARFWLAVASLWRREVVRFARQRSRIVGALGTPVVFWLFIGSGFGRSFRPPGTDFEGHYLQYAFPGTIALIVLFTAVFAMISIIEDRQAGFLQGVLVAPVGRPALALGKLLGSTTLAMIQALFFLLLAPLAGLTLTPTSVLCTIGVLILVSLSLSALGFVIAWSMDSTQGFHSVMNVFLIPMWLLSGAFFPPSGASGWLRWIMRFNPLTYGVSSLRHALEQGAPPGLRGEPTFVVSFIVTTIFCAAMVGIAFRTAAR